MSDTNNEIKSRVSIPQDIKNRLDELRKQPFTEETEKELTSIWSEFIQRLKGSGIDDNEWDHPDFVKQRRELENRVRQEIIRDRQLKPND
jgi:hypothetical protein